jgi:hypothetical protein
MRAVVELGYVVVLALVGGVTLADEPHGAGDK